MLLKENENIKSIKTILLVLILNSCNGIGDPGGEPIYDGFVVTIANSTNQIYRGEIVIGALKNNSFISTDSIQFERNLEIGNATGGFYFVNEKRWKPNLNKIKNIPSERCYFKLKLSNGRSSIITRYNSNVLFSLLLPEENYFKGDFGKLYLNIDDTQISGYAAEEF